MARIIEVTIAPQGETSIQTKGYAGGDCLQASQFLESALGVTVAEHKTTEFFQTQQQSQEIQA